MKFREFYRFYRAYRRCGNSIYVSIQLARRRIYGVIG